MSKHVVKSASCVINPYTVCMYVCNGMVWYGMVRYVTLRYVMYVCMYWYVCNGMYVMVGR